MAEYDLTCRIKPYIQPFERELAIRELTIASQAEPIPLSDSNRATPLVYRVVTCVDPRKLVHTLAYWESVTNGRTELTTQVLREATVNVARNGLPLSDSMGLAMPQKAVALPNRRYLRYGPHGIHEYRGKFFPQLVRALLNIADIPQGSIVLDPMCGSGTTPAEALLHDCRARGLDMNPLSVLISRTKCALLSIAPADLAAAYSSLRADIKQLNGTSTKVNLVWFRTLAPEDQAYLQQWFAPEVLYCLDNMMQRILTAPAGAIQNFFLIALSNVLRGVSWQKIEDLRVRREVRPATDYTPYHDFISELDNSAKYVLSFLHYDGPLKGADCRIKEGDARQASVLLNQLIDRTDAIVTSPPYATALPYLDTDRLSLSYLGILPRSMHRSRDQQMIGNREVTESQRSQFWNSYSQKRNKLPTAIQELIEKIDRLNQSTDVGFRRRNLPALLAKYFLDMRVVFQQWASLLKKNAPAFVVVGNNHTIAGGEHVDIETAALLGQLGEAAGLRFQYELPMEMLVSRDIFKKNTVASETILAFSRP